VLWRLRGEDLEDAVNAGRTLITTLMGDVTNNLRGETEGERYKGGGKLIKEEASEEIHSAIARYCAGTATLKQRNKGVKK